MCQIKRIVATHCHWWAIGVFIFSYAVGFPSAGLAELPRYDHVVIVVEENHSFDQVIGSVEAPYINSLVKGGALFTNTYGLTHPSQPNYMHLFSGYNQGIATDAVPTLPPLNTPNFGATLLANGYTFAAYSQGLPETGSMVAADGHYVRRHAPWTYWQDDSDTPGPNTLPGSLHMPFDQFPTDAAGFASLPTVTYVIPDQVNNMHSASIGAADDWLSANLSSYRDWAAENNSLLMVVWDEDNYRGDNRIPMI
ncbi:MAG: hypothetical protein KDB23_13900, partial [Planctomycetales bacterium]|nr:hypothetical protein [Planctomycetales bacterium]